MFVLMVLFLSVVNAEAKSKKGFVDVAVGPGAFKDATPEVLAAWLQYGFARTRAIKCKGYVYSFAEELAGRKGMLQFWKRQKRANPKLSNRYLDTLYRVERRGFLSDYVKFYHFKKYKVSKRFQKWRLLYLRGHRPQTYVRVTVDLSRCR